MRIYLHYIHSFSFEIKAWGAFKTPIYILHSERKNIIFLIKLQSFLRNFRMIAFDLMFLKLNYSYTSGEIRTFGSTLFRFSTLSDWNF